jgi:hypothetical protein
MITMSFCVIIEIPENCVIFISKVVYNITTARNLLKVGLFEKYKEEYLDLPQEIKKIMKQ